MHFVLALLGQVASVVVNWVAYVPRRLSQSDFYMFLKPHRHAFRLSLRGQSAKPVVVALCVNQFQSASISFNSEEASGEAPGGLKRAPGRVGPENVSNQKQCSINMAQIWRAGCF